MGRHGWLGMGRQGFVIRRTCRLNVSNGKMKAHLRTFKQSMNANYTEEIVCRQ